MNMLIKLAICLFLATHIHAGVTRFCSVTNVTRFRNEADSFSKHSVPSTYKPVKVELTESISYFNTGKLMEKVFAYNLTCSDIELLGGNVIGSLMTKVITPMLLSKGVLNIARTEFREALNFGPLPSIRNQTKPNKEEVESAPTLEDYYNLKEFDLVESSLYNKFVADSNIPLAISLLDKRFPSIRNLFRQKIREILQSNQGKMNREEIDRWTSEVSNFYYKIAFPMCKNLVELKCED